MARKKAPLLVNIRPRKVRRRKGRIAHKKGLRGYKTKQAALTKLRIYKESPEAYRMLYGARAPIGARKNPKRRVQRVKRNPIGRFVICATLENGKHFYFRKSTESFVAGLAAATRYRSAAVAMRTARLLLKQLPREIVSIKVDQVKR
jgi:hypothetical protein